MNVSVTGEEADDPADQLHLSSCSTIRIGAVATLPLAVCGKVYHIFGCTKNNKTKIGYYRDEVSGVALLRLT